MKRYNVRTPATRRYQYTPVRTSVPLNAVKKSASVAGGTVVLCTPNVPPVTRLSG